MIKMLLKNVKLGFVVNIIDSAYFVLKTCVAEWGSAHYILKVKIFNRELSSHSPELFSISAHGLMLPQEIHSQHTLLSTQCLPVDC